MEKDRPNGLADYTSLVSEAKERLLLCRATDLFGTGVKDAERMLLDLDKFPHHFVLACLMDRQIKAEKAWAIPYSIGIHLKGFEFSFYAALKLETIENIFREKRLHRFNNSKMPAIFFNGIRRIAGCYDGDAKNIWAGCPPCARVIRNFLEFDGAGPKIATMATNILVRQFQIPMTDRSAIDISPDVQVKKYFVRKGLLRENAKTDELIYLAREIYPEYPGLLDLLAWEQGRGGGS